MEAVSSPDNIYALEHQPWSEECDKLYQRTCAVAVFSRHAYFTLFGSFSVDTFIVFSCFCVKCLYPPFKGFSECTLRCSGYVYEVTFLPTVSSYFYWGSSFWRVLFVQLHQYQMCTLTRTRMNTKLNLSKVLDKLALRWTQIAGPTIWANKFAGEKFEVSNDGMGNHVKVWDLQVIWTGCYKLCHLYLWWFLSLNRDLNERRQILSDRTERTSPL